MYYKGKKVDFKRLCLKDFIKVIGKTVVIIFIITTLLSIFLFDLAIFIECFNSLNILRAFAGFFGLIALEMLVLVIFFSLVKALGDDDSW